MITRKITEGWNLHGFGEEWHIEGPHAVRVRVEDGDMIIQDEFSDEVSIPLEVVHEALGIHEDTLTQISLLMGEIEDLQAEIRELEDEILARGES